MIGDIVILQALHFPHRYDFHLLFSSSIFISISRVLCAHGAVLVVFNINAKCIFKCWPIVIGKRSATNECVWHGIGQRNRHSDYTMSKIVISCQFFSYVHLRRDTHERAHVIFLPFTLSSIYWLSQYVMHGCHGRDRAGADTSHSRNHRNRHNK